MLLVIFGAGASYDSAPHLPPPRSTADKLAQANYSQDRPPLANELFEDRTAFVGAMVGFPACLDLIPSLRRSGTAVERELARFQQQAETFPRRHQQIAAIRYYLHVALWECQRRWQDRHRGITSYGALLDEIERWRFRNREEVCFVTFNYDTILEETMERYLNFRRDNFNSYIQQKNYSVIKVHGSINWGREIDLPQTAGHVNHDWIIDHAAELKITDRYRFATAHPMLYEGDQVIFPALAIPVEKKDEFSCPASHVQVLESLLTKVTKIIVVGWRATETHFLGLLAHRLKRGEQDVLAVSGDQRGLDETFANLGKYVNLRSIVVQVAKGFTGLTNDLGILESFLGTKGT